MDDIVKINRTFWLIKSPKAKPDLVQKLCRHNTTYMFFVAPAAKGGARATVATERGKEFSEDGIHWNKLPDGLGPVTGKLDSRAYALVFDALETINESKEVDIWHYADFDEPDQPVRMILGCSTLCAIKKDMKDHPEKLKSRFRRIIAVAHLAMPYCVWIR